MHTTRVPVGSLECGCGVAVNQHVDDRNQTQVGPVQEQRVFLTTEQCLQP